MKKSRRKFSSAFKVTVAREALKERETLAKLSKRFEVHPTFKCNGGNVIFFEALMECRSIVKHTYALISNCSELIGQATIIYVSDKSIPAVAGLITLNCENLFTFSFFVLILLMF